ncbi:MAG: queuosine precursor transporter [Chloroflexi bacterium]|nr:queuosine precursor transporter [Chloroflexota bacterium]
MALFVSVLLISNLASSAKIIDWGVELLGLRLSIDAGTLVFPNSYIFGDVLTEDYSYKRALSLIWAGFGAAILMALTLWIVGLMPGEAAWQTYAGQDAYDAILGGIPGLIVASLAAYFAGEFSNSFLLAKMKVWTEGRLLWLRTIGSTLVGQGIDTVLFIAIASALGVFPWSIALSLIVSNYIFKVGIEVLFTPATYLIVNGLKQAEDEDYYDRDTDFNPFKLSLS